MKERPYQLSEFVAARRRAVLPPWVSRPPKRSGGRASPIPAHVRETGVALTDDERTAIRRRHALLPAAIDDALHGVEQAVRRSVERRRKKPLHGLSQRRAARIPRYE